MGELWGENACGLEGGGSTNSGLNVDDEVSANFENDPIRLPANSLFFVRTAHLLQHTVSTWRSSGYGVRGVTFHEGVSCYNRICVVTDVFGHILS